MDDLVMVDNLKIKFCGMKNEQDIKACLHADYLGFIVGVPTSKRNVTLEQAKALTSSLKSKNKVSVAVTTDLTLLETISTKVKPDIIQIHTQILDIDAVQKILQKNNQRYALTIGCSETEILNEEVLNHELATKSEYIIIDSITNKTIAGGTGQTRNYSKSATIIQNYKNLHFLLAGGLKPSNILSVLYETEPYGIDVSSGIENANMEKDKQLVTQLLTNIELYNQGDYNVRKQNN